MKKLLTFFLTALLTFSVGWAAEVTFNASTDKGSVTTNGTTANGDHITKDGVTVTSSNGPMGNGTDYRVYTGGTLTVTSSSGNITKIEMTFTASGTSNYGPSKISATGYSYSGKVGTWQGTAASSVTLNATAQVRITQIVVTVTGGATVVSPTISPNGGNFGSSQVVTLSHDDADVAIYYTTNGAEPTTSSTLYTSPFTIYETTTVKAIAVKNGVSSSPATATFNEVGVGSIATAYALAQGSQFVFTGNAVVTYQYGRNVWIRDNSGSGLIYRISSETGSFTNGDILDAGWAATNTTYSSIPEFNNASGVTSSSNGGTVAPVDMTSTGITSTDVNKYVSLSNVTLSWDYSVGYCYVTIGGNTVYFRDYFNNGLSVTSNHTYDIEGIAYIYGGNNYVYLTKVTEIVTGDPLLEVNPSTLTINDSGTNNTFTVEGSYLGDDNVGLTQNGSNFTPSLSATTGSATNGGTYWYFTPAGGSVNGTVAMNYNGRELSASETVSLGNNSGASATVTVNYVADLYIVTDNGVTNDWHFDGAYGEHMTNNNGVYTATFTAENPNTFILFARKTGEGVTWNTRYVFGPSSGGDWWLPIGGNGNGTIDVNTSNPIKIQEAGTYIITINANDGTFTITKEEAPQGDVYVKVTSNDDLVSGDYLIVYETDSKAFDGSLADMDPVNNVFDVTISNNKIITDKAAYFTIDTDAGTIYSASGKYIGRASNSNGFNQSETTAYTHTITIDNSANAIITSSNGPKLQMWSQTSNGVMQYRFRYYSSNQKSIQLYRKQGGSTVVTAPVITPEGGTSNKHFESFNVTITAAEGCTIYYTTDGSTPTTSSTQYSAPFLLPYGSEPTTVKAIAVDGQGTVSAVASMTYYWDRVSVTINPASQHVTGDVNVTITATPSDATVTYTINGGAVQTYNGEFIVPVNETNSPVTVEVTATKGESTATTSATYTLVDASATLYTKVTSADQIQADLQYILVHEAGPHALNNFTSSATGGTGVTVAWETQGSVIDIAGTDAIQFTLSGDINSAKFYYGDNIYLGRSGNNGLANNSETEWMILKKDASENDPGGYYLAVGTASNSYRLRYNTSMGGADKFRCYNNNTGDPVYLYVQGVVPVTEEITLSDLVQTGIETKKYTITNQLHAVKVTWDKNEGKFAIFAKDNQEYANKSYPTADQESYLIRYQNGSFINEVAQENYDQSNWIEILIPSDVTLKDPNSPNYQSTLDGLKETFENKILAAGSITGKYVDALNPTIEVTINPSAESASTYTPNIYCTANFPMYNFENGGAQGNDGIYFMMDPKPHEFCKVVWAYYGGSGNYFIAPQREGDEINGHDFKGSFLANMSLCEDIDVVYEDVAPYFSNSTEAGLLYGFNAIVRKTEASQNQANGAPHRIQPSDSGTETNPAYVVYPLNASSSSSDNVVDVKELLGGKTIESVHYYNMMGMEGKTPFEGINIVVTRYTDGSTSTYKVMK